MKFADLTEKRQRTVLKVAAFGTTYRLAEMLDHCWSAKPTDGFLGAMVRDEVLVPISLQPGLTGYVLDRRFCSANGWDRGLVRPFGSLQGSLLRIAGLTDSSRRHKLPLAVTDGDLRDLRSTDYRLVPGETRPVALLTLDAGGNPIRVRKRVKALFLAAQADPALGPLLAADEFAVRVLTTTFEKADVLLQAFRAAPPPGPVEVMPVPEITKWLLNL